MDDKTLQLVGPGFQDYVDAAVEESWPGTRGVVVRVGDAIELHAHTPDGRTASTKMSAAAGRHKLDGDPARHGLVYERELAWKVDILAQSVKNLRLMCDAKNDPG